MFEQAAIAEHQRAAMSGTKHARDLLSQGSFNVLLWCRPRTQVNTGSPNIAPFTPLSCSYADNTDRRRWSVAARRGDRLQPFYPSPNVRASQPRHGLARPRMSACAYTTNCRPRCQHVLHAGNAAAFRVSHPRVLGLTGQHLGGSDGTLLRERKVRSRPPAALNARDCAQIALHAFVLTPCFRLFRVHRCAQSARMGRRRPRLDA
jgi:hypothetical protein